MTTVETSLGTVQGTERRGSHIFLGIRYAQPPVSDLRFCAPRPVQRWEGMYDATQFGASAPQPAKWPCHRRMAETAKQHPG